MLSEDEKAKIISRYCKRLEEYGYSPKTLGWFKRRQRLRFRILTSIEVIREGETLLDLGCGFGDLYAFISTYYAGVKYTGTDINPSLIEVGQKIYPTADLRVIDVLENDIGTFDWVVASGVFNHRLEHISNEDFIQAMIKKMFDIAKKGVSIDFMSTYVDFMNLDAYHTSPEWVFNIAKALTKRVTLRHDYMPYEFCVYLYKDQTITQNNVFGCFEE